jgi:hypothetical protein
LPVSVNIREIPNLSQDFFRQLSFHEESYGLVTSDDAQLRSIDRPKYGIELRLLCGRDKPISAR